MRPTVYLPAAALALLAAPVARGRASVGEAVAVAPVAAPAHSAVADTTPEQRERDRRAERAREQAREQARERARRARRELAEAERELARAERDARTEQERDARAARKERERAEREARDDLGLGELGRTVGDAVREGVRGAAEGMRAASEALRTAEGDRDDDADVAGASATRLDTTVAVGREPTVDLSLVNGPVTVTAWGRGEVRVRATSERVPLRFDASGGTVRVYSPRTRTRSTGDQRLEVEVPVGTRVIARSVSGDVHVRGVRGEIEARSTSGDVEADGGVRAVTLHTVSGDVRGTSLEGVVNVQSVSGDVDLDGVTGELGAQTTSGDVRLRRARLTRVRAETVSGDVGYDGTIARGGRYDLTSHSGGIHLALPADAAAALSVRTYSGTIDTSFPLTMTPTPRGQPASPRRVEFTLNGGGGAQVTAESFSGNIVIARPNP
jgi:hypothetical protein